jgi:hypothetical protein
VSQIIKAKQCFITLLFLWVSRPCKASIGISERTEREIWEERSAICVNLNAKGLGQRTPLHYAAELGQVEVMKLLLDEDDIGVRVRDAYGHTALGLCLHEKEVAGLLRSDRRYEKGDELSHAGVEHR